MARGERRRAPHACHGSAARGGGPSFTRSQVASSRNVQQTRVRARSENRMAATSTMSDLGSRLPSFALPDVTTGRMVSDADVGGTTALLVMFICRHCPYVAHVREELARLAVDYADADVAFVAISSNDPETYPKTRRRASPRKPGSRATGSRTCSTRRRRSPRRSARPVRPTSSCTARRENSCTGGNSTTAGPGTGSP